VDGLTPFATQGSGGVRDRDNQEDVPQTHSRYQAPTPAPGRGLANRSPLPTVERDDVPSHRPATFLGQLHEHGIVGTFDASENPVAAAVRQVSGDLGVLPPHELNAFDGWQPLGSDLAAEEVFLPRTMTGTKLEGKYGREGALRVGAASDHGRDEHPVLERHYVCARSRRQPSVLVFLPQDAEGRAFCYSNADIRKGEEPEEIFRFITFWKRVHQALPRHLVFDSRLTTYPNLARLDQMGIAFITLRRRSAQLLKEIAQLPRSAWRTLDLDVPTRKFRTPRAYEQKVRLAGHWFRQIFILDLGHEQPTILLTNEARTPIKNLITRYAHRMLIENALSDAVRFFHMDALSSAVGFKVDFDMTLLVIASASTVCSRAACAAIATPKPATSSVISSICRPRSISRPKPSPCRSIAGPSCPF